MARRQHLKQGSEGSPSSALRDRHQETFRRDLVHNQAWLQQPNVVEELLEFFSIEEAASGALATARPDVAAVVAARLRAASPDDTTPLPPLESPGIDLHRFWMTLTPDVRREIMVCASERGRSVVGAM